MNARNGLTAAIAALALSVAAPAWAETVVLRALDKATGLAHDIEAPIGKPVKFGTLKITARACAKHAPEETPEVSAYLLITDKPLADAGAKEKPEAQVFSGWMFASSPALNALQHPSYDVWVIDCKS
jgi:hypothetical protein